MSLTRQLREELAHTPTRVGAGRVAEASAIVRFGGALRLRGGGGRPQVSVVVRCADASVARRLRGTLVDTLGIRPGLARAHGGNLSGSDAYLVEVESMALEPMGILDADGHLLQGIAPTFAAHDRAYLAGVLMVAGSLSGAGRPVHLEVAAPGDRTAQDLGSLLKVRAQGTRVVLKDGERVGELLAAVGAHQTFIAFDRGRMHRELRGKVTRSVNADRANLRRTADSASTHIAAIQGLVDLLGWEGIPEDLRDTALVRVVNPEASLSDLGRLLDPEVGKATVHRRLKRLEALDVLEARRADGQLEADGQLDADRHATDWPSGGPGE